MRLIQPKPRIHDYDVTDDVTVSAEPRSSVTSLASLTWIRHMWRLQNIQPFSVLPAPGGQSPSTFKLFFSISSLLTWAKRREINWRSGAAYSVLKLQCHFCHLAFLKAEIWHTVEQRHQDMDSTVTTTQSQAENNPTSGECLSIDWLIDWLIDWFIDW